MAVLTEIATVHEKTVQRAQEHADSAAAKVHSIRTGHQRRSVVHKIKVDPRVWQTALDLAGGDTARITVVHATEVVVHNHPQKGNRHYA